MTPRVPPWLAQPPWLTPSVDVPAVHAPPRHPTDRHRLALLRGHYVPAFGMGLSRDETARALALALCAFGPWGSERSLEAARTMVAHPELESLPARFVGDAARARAVEPEFAALALALPGLLGCRDRVRSDLATQLSGLPLIALEVRLAACVGGGDALRFREHYAMISAAPEAAEPALRAARAWFDWVLARRFSGLDALLELRDQCALDAPSRLLVASAELIAGDDTARARMAEVTDEALSSLRGPLPALYATAASELASLVMHPLALRRDHLRCAAMRDHAARAIKAWLAEPPKDDEAPEAERAPLTPEPSRAGRAAIEAHAAAGEFLLDWFIDDASARDHLDRFAEGALRLYHRLRGACLLARTLPALEATLGPDVFAAAAQALAPEAP